MKVVIHRGTHQIGGIVVEISTKKTRIIIDMGDELSLDPNFNPQPIQIEGVTDKNGNCNATLFTHYHRDHIGQIKNIRDDIPIYIGPLAKDILLTTIRNAEKKTINKIQNAMSFVPGEAMIIGDITITPFSIDHSACDSYMFLIEAEGKRILYTGDFRLHGFRGKAIPKILEKLVGKVDVLITEGTTLSRASNTIITEPELNQKAKEYIKKYKYVFVYCASTNLERICGLSKIVPRGKYFLCDNYQYELLELLEQKWANYSSFYRNIKKSRYSDKKLENYRKRGFIMMVRDNYNFRNIVKQFDKSKSIMLYSMLDGYRTNQNSTIPEFLNLAGKWETLHTSGHASPEDIKLLIETTSPSYIIPIHTLQPDMLKTLCPNQNVILLQDKEEFVL